MNLESIYKKVSLVNQFEDKVIQYIKEGRITIPVYLSKGQEIVAAILSELCRGWNIFTQHRSHDYYLCFGGNPKKLMDELMGLPTGTSGGRAGSNCIHDLSINMWGHHGLIGENVPIATGFAFGSRKPTLCIFGDGAAEEDYIGPSLGFAAKHKLPILYVCLDNGLSVLTPIEVRRDWHLIHIANSYGLFSFEKEDKEFSNIYLKIYTIINSMNLPTLCNILVCRKHWHVGTGIDNEPEWDTYLTLRSQIDNADKIDEEVRESIKDV